MAARSLREARVEAERMTLATRAALAADGELLVEAQVDADRMLLATQSALDADGALLDPAQRAAIEASMAQLRAGRGASDAASIEAATQALGRATEAFAALRMNHGIQRALAGRSIESV